MSLPDAVVQPEKCCGFRLQCPQLLTPKDQGGGSSGLPFLLDLPFEDYKPNNPSLAKLAGRFLELGVQGGGKDCSYFSSASTPIQIFWKLFYAVLSLDYSANAAGLLKQPSSPSQPLNVPDWHHH